jgi:hypothetical protein
MTRWVLLAGIGCSLVGFSNAADAGRVGWAITFLGLLVLCVLGVVAMIKQDGPSA